MLKKTNFFIKVYPWLSDIPIDAPSQNGINPSHILIAIIFGLDCQGWSGNTMFFDAIQVVFAALAMLNTELPKP